MAVQDWEWLPQVTCRANDRDWTQGTWQDAIVLCQVARAYGYEEDDLGMTSDTATWLDVDWEFIQNMDGTWTWLQFID